MSITDELRKWVPQINGYKLLRTCDEKELTAIADRIDAAHERAMAAAALIAGVPMTDENMAEHGWVRLPVDGEAPCKQLSEWIEKRGLITGPLDHDGELWHRGDMSDSNWGEIEGIVYENGKWFISGHDTSAPWIPANSIGHYHAPTVEDVLEDFYRTAKADSDANMGDLYETIAEYAAKLQLRGDAE